MRLAVFGSPVAHSLSPRIHGLFARQCGLQVDYRAIEASAATFAGLVRTLAEQGARGCNVTVPFKQAAWELAARSSEEATRARAANTLVFEPDGTWYADNTDGPGLVDDLAARPGCRLAGARICLLGAGGAAAGILGALLRVRPARVVIANRTLERARQLAERHADLGTLDTCSPVEIGARAPFELLINSTSAGHDGVAPALAPEWLAPSGLCYDLNYGSAAEPLRLACERLGIAYSDGLGMLVGQAARSFQLWTGQRPDAAAVLADLRRQH
ncbi:MAG: shikimate dehydrogenase [Lysobacterales bacterium]|nr:MAG: shikimate dehydrogenase [Xanthomonadales bacterium]